MKIKFDSLDKKPHLYPLIFPVVFASAAVFLLVRSAPDGNPAAVCAVTAALCAVIIFALVRALIRQIRYNPYSYNTIYYAGFALFTLFVLFNHFYLFYMLAKYSGQITAADVLSIWLNSAKNYMLMTSPFLLFFSASLCVSNISLIRHEGRKLSNLFGILLSFVIVAGGVFIFQYDYYATGSEFEVMMHDIFINTVAALYLYLECMIAGVIFAGALAARHEPEKDKDYIIILGCGLKKDGTPTPLLRGRIDRALEFARRQEEQTGKAPCFVTSGGKGEDEVISESAAMANYLLENGVPEERIIREDRSTSTFENMKFSKELIESAGEGGKIAFSTTNYHVFRSGLYARRVKMRAVGMGAKTKGYFWPNAAVREFAGLLSAHRLKQAIILGSMIAVYVALTLLAYDP